MLAFAHYVVSHSKLCSVSFVIVVLLHCRLQYSLLSRLSIHFRLRRTAFHDFRKREVAPGPRVFVNEKRSVTLC